MRKHTAIDKLQEARRIYDSAVVASQALVEQATALNKDVASLRTEVDVLAAAVADHGKALRGASLKLIVMLLVGGFLGSLLGNAAFEACSRLLFGSETS